MTEDKIDELLKHSIKEIQEALDTMREKYLPPREEEPKDWSGVILDRIAETEEEKGQALDRQVWGSGYETTTVPSPDRHGHPRFYVLLDNLAELHSRKNHDYAGGGEALGNFYRRADLYSKYPGLDLSDPAVVAIVDSMKQLDAALWLLSSGHKAQVEGIFDRLRDVAVYSVLAMIMVEEKVEEKGSIA